MTRSRSVDRIFRALAAAAVTVVLTGTGLVAGAGPAVAEPACDDRGDSIYDAEPTTEDYLSGRVCPPSGFPYRPNIIDTDSGQRAVDPYTDGCSHVPEKAWNFNRWNACATHDYAYDLWRFGTVGLSKVDADQIFYEDMMADCRGRRLGARQGCEASARAYREGVSTLGWPAMGDVAGITASSA